MALENWVKNTVAGGRKGCSVSGKKTMVVFVRSERSLLALEEMPFDPGCNIPLK